MNMDLLREVSRQFGSVRRRHILGVRFSDYRSAV